MSSALRLDRRMSVERLEHASVSVADSAVVALTADGEERRVRIETVHALVLGPGTTVTHAAIRACSRSGCAVVFTDAAGTSVDTTVAPLTSEASLAVAQASAVSRPTQRLAVARRMLAERFGIAPPNWASGTRLMGWEGTLMRRAYHAQAKRYGVEWRGRVTDGPWDELDAPNRMLSSCSPLLYAAAAVTCSALRLHPDLGVLHAPRDRGFVYDIADIWKLRCLVIPVFAYMGAGGDTGTTGARQVVAEALEQSYWPEAYNTLRRVLI